MNSAIQWLDSQRDEMLQLLARWCEINSGTHNLNGIAEYRADVETEFASLGGEMKHHDLPPMETIDSIGNIIHTPLGKSVSFTKRPHAPTKIFLCIHLDTVYSPQHSFQHVERVDEKTLRGPGVADAKGGLVVMLFALRAFERSEFAKNLGWEVLLNTDEEIGSLGSASLLADAAKRNYVGLL